MKRIIILLTLSCLLFIPSHNTLMAQTVEKPDYAKNEIAFSYGFLPATDFIEVLSFLFSLGTISTENTVFTGAFTGSYSYRLAKMVGLGVSFTYSSIHGDVIEGGVVTGERRSDFYSVMANAKINWINAKWFTLYSKAGVGALYANTIDTRKNIVGGDGCTIALQLSPLGFEIGKSVAFFAEGGFGSTGIIMAGIRARF